jgi:hypothetical protein
MDRRSITLLALAVAGILGIAVLVAARGRGPANASSAQVAPRVPAPKAAFPPQTPPVRVFVKRVAQGVGRVEYRYTVVNRSTFPVTTLLIGFDEYYGVPRLVSYPLGWDGDSIPPTSFQTPPGWTFYVQPMEENPLVAVTWQRTRSDGAIEPGDSLSGFAVVVEQPDSTYDRGGLWTAYASGHEPFFGAIQAGK